MNVTVKKISVPSSDGIHNLVGVVYLPDSQIKGIYHIVHGMTEHIGRYKRIMTDLADKGYICVGYDNLGHGYTAKDKSELGYIADNDGWDLLSRDVALFAAAVKKEYGEDLPYYLMGHSMGSFIVRLSAERYFVPDKLIIMGTGGPNPAAGAGLTVIALIKLLYGRRHISKLVDKLAFGSYNKKFTDTSQKGSWLTTDLEVRKKYWEDDFCTFKFTVSAMGDLIKLMKNSNRNAWFKNVSSSLPILLLSGENDPVGNYGEGISYVTQKLKRNGKNAECVLYKGARHEILNDFTYTEVLNDIVKFIE
ncbi:MAG: alpha/beta hydrolase [Clostridia bacterium]|nr:alpha/beta hydrolase [Clostridia bacterium]